MTKIEITNHGTTETTFTMPLGLGFNLQRYLNTNYPGMNYAVTHGSNGAQTIKVLAADGRLIATLQAS
jgi:hypothetical protein